MMVWVTVSMVEITCALAWNSRCAVIMLTSCSVRSTLEASSAPAWIRPKFDSVASPRWATPELKVSWKDVSLTLVRPSGLEKFASATLPRAID